MASLTRWVLAHKRFVVVGWVVLTVAGIATMNSAIDKMDQQFSVPGKEGWEASVDIAKTFGNGGDTAPIIPVVTLPKGRTVAQAKGELAALERKVDGLIPHGRVAGYGSTGSRAFVSKDGRTTFIVAYPGRGPSKNFGQNVDLAKTMTAALKGEQIAGAPVRVTGYDALTNDSGDDGGGSVLVEAVFGGIGALIVLIFVFGSWLAVVPLLLAVCSIMTTFFTLFAVTRFTSISPIVQFLVIFVGLGVAIDYALLVSVRWREERTHGLENADAVARSMATAGRAVVFSGTTVAIGLLALVVLPLPFLRSMGAAGLLIPLLSVAVTITLLPVILLKWGPALDKHRMRSDNDASRWWTRWAKGVVHRRWVAVAGAVVILGLLLISASNINLGNTNLDTVAKTGPARVGLEQLKSSGIGPGVLYPNEIAVRGGSPERVAARAARIDGIHGAVAPVAWRRHGLAVVDAYSSPDPSSPKADTVVKDLRAALDGSTARVGGGEALNMDFIDAVYGSFPLMIALISFTTFLLLARAFRSILLPIKAIALNIVSIGAALGVLAFVWQSGHGSHALWGIEATGTIEGWIPLMIFAFLFGLSMDYEVFILSRMREEYDRTGSTEQAVIIGIGRTGRLVTSAALILFLAFVALGAAPGTSVRILATGFAAGILIDATVIRMLFVPAVVSLFGRWNWWLPARAARVLRVAPSEG